MIDCPKCDGYGRLEVATNWGVSTATDPGYEERKCDLCRGSGKVEDEEDGNE